MKNRFLLFLFTSVLTISSFGNSIKIKGLIKSEVKGEPVHFANVAISESNKGTTSDYNGLFELLIDSNDLNNTLNISCLSFKNLKVKISDLKTEEINELTVQPITYKIPEVIITPNSDKKKSIVLNQLKKSEINGLLTCDNLPRIYARFFPFNSENKEMNVISTLSIGFRSDQQKDDSKVRIRILTKDPTNNRPDKDLLHEDLIISVKSGIEKVDISKYNIQMPTSGIFVAVEWLIIEENKFEWVSFNKKVKKTKFKYGPILGANYRQNSFTWIFWAGEWNKYDKKVPMIHPKIKEGSYFDSAISITLSN